MESKIELTERLRKEGRWAEASKFKDTALADFRAKGMKRDEAAEAAWAAMAEAYPPLPVAEGPAEPAAGTPEAMTTYSPPIPWSDLPTEGDFDEEVRWVHQQYILIIEESPRGRVIHWERATKKPPSTGACSLARWAADNRTAFYKELLPRTMAKASPNQEEEANIREEKLKIGEIERILKQIEDGMATAIAVFSQMALARSEVKIDIETDLEGASGVYKFAQTREKDAPLNVQASEYLMGDIAAVVRGLRDAGATEILILDGHGSQAFIPHLMEPGAKYLTGKPRPRGLYGPKAKKQYLVFGTPPAEQRLVTKEGEIPDLAGQVDVSLAPVN